MLGEDGVLNHAAAMEVQRMYALKDARGRRIWSYRSLGVRFDCSETTILRVINKQGPYVGLPTPIDDAEMTKRAEESKAKLLAKLAEPTPAVHPKENSTGPREVIDPVSGKPIKLPY